MEKSVCTFSNTGERGKIELPHFGACPNLVIVIMMMMRMMMIMMILTTHNYDDTRINMMMMIKMMMMMIKMMMMMMIYRFLHMPISKLSILHAIAPKLFPVVQ